MSDETTETNDGTLSGLKKTLIGTLTTVIAGGGIWLSTTLFGGGHEDKAEPKTEQVAPAAQPVINVNLSNNNTNEQKQQSNGGTTTIIKERIVEKAPAEKKEKPVKKSETEDAPW
jgi:hypothetical protein